MNDRSLTSVFDASEKGIFIFDASGSFVDMNKAAMEIFGVEDKESFRKLNINIFEDPNFQIPFEEVKNLHSDLKFDIVYDFAKLKEKYSGFTQRVGTIWADLTIRNLFDPDGKREFVVVYAAEISDNSLLKLHEAKINYNLAPLMKSEGLSTWVYDVANDTRIAVSGPHTFPELVRMSDFMHHLHSNDANILNDIIVLIEKGIKREGHATIRYVVDEKVPEYIYLSLSCMAQEINGNSSMVAFMTKDITESTVNKSELVIQKRKLTRASDNLRDVNMLLYTLIGRMPCIFYMKNIDDDFRYVNTNETFCGVVGKRRDEVLGHTDHELFQTMEDEKTFRENDELAVRRGYLSQREETLFGGKRRVWQTTKYCINTNLGQRLLIGLSQDITSMDDAYQELLAAKEKAEQSDKLKSAFLANMSHEIRTPLNSILGFSEMIVDIEDLEDKEHFKNVILSNGKLLLNIINDVLDLSKIEAGYLDLKQETEELSSIFQGFDESFRARIPTNLEFICEMPGNGNLITVDCGRLTQIVDNYVSNSIKYTKSGYIKISSARERNGFRITVEDTGIGIADTDKPKLFKRFSKIDDFAQGTGLGLSISKALAERMGGKTGFESVLGKGSCFWVWLPVTPRK